MNTKCASMGVERKQATFGSSRRTYDRTVIPQIWNSFQSLRQHNRANLTSGQGTKRNFSNQPTSSNDTFEVSWVTRNETSQCSKRVSERKSSNFSKKNDQRWARNWANHRAHQAVLTRDQASERSKSCETRSTEETMKMNVSHRSLSVRSRNIELGAKAAETFSRLRSIYVNDEERNRRLQCIRERMNEFQKRTIKKEVNKSIQEFNKRVKEDEQNRKELRRVREKFLETKKQRLKHMHVSRNALEVPSVSRLAYGLPKDGREFSVALSSKKTTNEIKNLWRMAFVRKQCIDSFINKASQRHQELPDITVKPRLRTQSFASDSSFRGENSNVVRPKNHHLEEIKEAQKKSDKPSMNSFAKLQSGILDTFESLSSEDEDYE